MLVYVDSDVFVGGLRDPLPLVEMVALGHARRHTIVAVPPLTTDPGHPANVWLGSLGARLRARLALILQEGLREAANLPAGCATIRVSTASTNWTTATLTVEDATRCLRTPLKLLLENRRNDLAFLSRLVPAPLFATIRRGMELGWIEVEQGGGIEEVRNLLEDICTAPPNDTTSAIHRLRLWVMVDRDSNSADRQLPSDRSNAVMDVLLSPGATAPWQLNHLRLHRRTMENYLPPAVFWLWQSQGRHDLEARRDVVLAVENLARTRSAAYWYLSMKKGLLGDLLCNDAEFKAVSDGLRDVIDADLDPTFHCLSPAERKLFLRGFGRAIGNLYADESFSWEGLFSAEYKRGPLNQPTREAIAASILTRI